MIKEFLVIAAAGVFCVYYISIFLSHAFLLVETLSQTQNATGEIIMYEKASNEIEKDV